MHIIHSKNLELLKNPNRNSSRIIKIHLKLYHPVPSFKIAKEKDKEELG